MPTRNTFQRHIFPQKDVLKLNIQHIFNKVRGTLILTADSWSSRLNKGYMCVAVNWIDENWKVKSKLLDFKHFPTPHTGSTKCDVLYELLEDFHLGGI